jgi:hypothetical protein
VEVTSNQFTISTKVTVTTDLGESFYNGDVALISSLWVENENLKSNKVICHNSHWRAGMRVLGISIPASRDLYEVAALGQVWLQIGVAGETSYDPLPALWDRPSSLESLNIISAFTTVQVNPQTDWSAWRRLQLANSDVLRIGETPGSNIACHIWSVAESRTQADIITDV